MIFALWSKYDAQMYSALRQLPEELEGNFLDTGEFRAHFKDFNGRPVQDIVEALHHSGQKGHFEYETMLAPEYLQHGKALAKVTDALNELRGTAPDVYSGLGAKIHAKVVAEQPLTKTEASSLPDGAKDFLRFKLLDVDRYGIDRELNNYKNSPASLERPDPRPAPPKFNLNDINLTPESYDKRKGVLHLALFHARIIAGKTGVKRPNDKKYIQCLIMERVFKSSRTIGSGVEISTILGIHKSRVDKTTTKNMANAVAEINRKVAKDNGLKKLLIMDGKKIKVNTSYL